ncbi:hypothetical protein [Polymorphum gilvum]|uniref:Uncharacterized protein n=1 Tax=Polymorphum gilvum (strain LMG 25793 / CGMCC 1.9160 / SL003B-26A1) TaxID=991905 RepID=F2IZZ2_POLGS|nr:hypothetical protein [Polymorphum gilvum]ADZ71827.1 hypothetical protein SL003B_3405 [Polymorphum gilvum SL003B-26A1]
MRTWLKAAAVSTALLAALPAAAADKVSNLVTLLTAAEAQTQLMAMVLTMESVQQGASAHILLCGPAADMALKQAPDSATAPQKPKGMSPQGLMKMIMDKGGTVEVCAIYLPNRESDASVLIDGVTPAKPGEMAARLLAADTRLLSF